MARGGADKSGGVRKKARANSMGLQWWRKLTLPRRGKKDSLLEPAPLTETQQNRLVDRRATLKKAIVAPRVARQKHMASADWIPAQNVARVTATRGNSMQSMGYFENGAQYLYPEEALFLVDKGTFDLCVDGLPASFQRAWAIAMIAENGVRLEEYLTFAHLRRAGYVVRRYEPEENVSSRGLSISYSAWRVGSFKRKEPIRPLFHVAVFRYSDVPPSITAVSKFLDISGKTRLKFALIDRGVVVLTDVANNATPLSERFLRRLPPVQQSGARELREGCMGSLIELPELLDAQKSELDNVMGDNAASRENEDMREEGRGHATSLALSASRAKAEPSTTALES